MIVFNKTISRHYKQMLLRNCEYPKQIKSHLSGTEWYTVDAIIGIAFRTTIAFLTVHLYIASTNQIIILALRVMATQSAGPLLVLSFQTTQDDCKPSAKKESVRCHLSKAGKNLRLCIMQNPSFAFRKNIFFNLGGS